jgi:hypothetical protein
MIGKFIIAKQSGQQARVEDLWEKIVEKFDVDPRHIEDAIELYQALPHADLRALYEENENKAQIWEDRIIPDEIAARKLQARDYTQFLTLSAMLIIEEAKALENLPKKDPVRPVAIAQNL